MRIGIVVTLTIALTCATSAVLLAYGALAIERELDVFEPCPLADGLDWGLNDFLGGCTHTCPKRSTRSTRH